MGDEAAAERLLDQCPGNPLLAFWQALRMPNQTLALHIAQSARCGLCRRLTKADGHLWGGRHPIGYGATPLFIALILERHDVVDLLLAAGADTSIRDESFGHTALHAACIGGYLPMVRIMRHEVNARDNRMVTPLHIAVAHKHFVVATELIAAGADIDASDVYGRTPLYNAVVRGNGDAVKLLLEEGASVSAQADDGDTALHNAASTFSIEAVEALLDHGADPDAIGNGGRTPLHLATLKNQTAKDVVVCKLLEEGADPNAMDDAGCTPKGLARHW